MEVIPVLDLKDGIVVHARMGVRSQYGPLMTALSPTSKPKDVALGLLSIFPFSIFYIADLDAIERKGNNNATLLELKVACPNVVFWVDSGVADLDGAQHWLEADLGHLVLGTETQKNCDVVRYLCRDDRVILSLDYRGDVFVGPAPLLSNTDAWPTKIIVMTLARVGSASGPDMHRLATIKSSAANRQIYAAGGVRDVDDLAALGRAGITGALVATCLHNGMLSGVQIARLKARS